MIYLLALLLTLPTEKPTTQTYQARVIGVTDGDTITVLREGTQIKIRLEGVDAPESKQDYGTATKTRLSELVHGRNVEIRQTGTDRYRRTLAYVVVDGREINLQLLREGLAWHYVRYNSEERYAEAEQEARELKQGLWAMEAVAPWEWRKKK